ncbi:MAG: protein-L-isoaspartate(D-aspartate) O-methyltransferase [Acidobacteriota bacterium]
MCWLALVFLTGPPLMTAGPPAREPQGEAPAPARQAERDAMVEQQIRARGLETPRVLEAMRQVPRHRFLPPSLQKQAYADGPLPIGAGQTMSQPYIVALMTELAQVAAGDRVLEVGTGSGYQAAVLAALGCHVHSIEIIPSLAEAAAARLERLGYADVTVRSGDGYLGWPDAAPFDAILITAAPPRVPEPLLHQLAPGGRLVAPVGEASQELVVVTRTGDGYRRRTILPVRFVPMTGQVRHRPGREDR